MEKFEQIDRSVETQEIEKIIEYTKSELDNLKIENSKTDIEQKESIFEKDYGKLITFFKEEKNLDEKYIIGLENLSFDICVLFRAIYHSGMYNKKFDNKLLNVNRAQIENLLDEYNSKNHNDPIEKDSFKEMFLKKKQDVYPISLELETNQNIKENQEVSKFILTIEHQEAIRNRINKIIENNDEVSKIEISGWASGDLVNDDGIISAKNQINNTLEDLKEKGFDISKLPVYDDISKQNWFDPNTESLNKGNHSRAYARALMQLNSMTKEQLKYLYESKIILDIKSNLEKGDEKTGGSIDFYGYNSSYLEKIREHNNILEQSIKINFYVLEEQKTLSNPNDNINILKRFGAKIDDNVNLDNVYTTPYTSNIRSNIPQEYRLQKGGRTKFIKGRVAGHGSYDIIISLTKEQAKKYKEELNNNSLENWDFEKFVDIYKEVGGPNLEKDNQRLGKENLDPFSIIEQYREYPKKLNNIQEELIRIKNERGEELLGYN